MFSAALSGALRGLNRNGRRLGRPFDPATPIAAPHGTRASWVHYGVMVPALPEPYRTFGVMAIVGTPGLALFANDQEIRTSPRDTAYVVSATAVMTGEAFHAYSVARDCEIRPDGTLVRFGDDVLIQGAYPTFRIHRKHPEVEVDLQLDATDKVTYFADYPGDLYTHWSLLCQYRGSLDGVAVAGLCTYEYAHGVGVHSVPVRGTPNLPASFFTYHVLNVDDVTQVLMTHVLGPRGTVLARGAYVRGLDDYGAEHRDATFTVETYEEGVRTTPAGRPMRLPATITWSARANGADFINVRGTCNGDWAYGLGAGYVGSYRYIGKFRGEPIAGTAYIEYVDLRADHAPQLRGRSH